MAMGGKKIMEERLDYSDLPVLSPAALVADPGDKKAFLRWNPQREDERIIGWSVFEVKGKRKYCVSKDIIDKPYFVVDKLNNGRKYEFCVRGILSDGSQTPDSNRIEVIPIKAGKAMLKKMEKEEISFGKWQGIKCNKNSAKVVFPDGQELVYSNFRPVDWKTETGEHLIYPGLFGNGLDIGCFQKNGLPRIIPPEGLNNYSDAQKGTLHPFITDPLTPTYSQKDYSGKTRWNEPKIKGNKVIFNYLLPLEVTGYKSWTYVLIWETWWPIKKEIYNCKYQGLARTIEVEMPSFIKNGYQVMINNGFGPGGSRQNVVSYSSGFRMPGHEVVDFSAEKNRQVSFKKPTPPRTGNGYHPNQNSLQSSPLIFYDWEKGSMIISARHLYYHCANNSSTYIEQGADGVWPNLAWDIGISGQKVVVDTVEYLYTEDMQIPLPQRFTDSLFSICGDLSNKMNLQDDLANTSTIQPSPFTGEVKKSGGPLPFAKKYCEELEGTGIDGVMIAHDFWMAVPVTVNKNYRTDEEYDCNLKLKEMCDYFKEKDISPGFWFRPEFVKTSLVSALSSRMPGADTYYGYNCPKYPRVSNLLEKRGIPLLRDNQHWIRRNSDGSWPENTPYQWTPISLATDWWSDVMWPTLKMAGKLGFEFVLHDGGQGGLQGVDNTPFLNNEMDYAVACQPYWWRVFRSMYHTGIKLSGECTTGWKGGRTNIVGPGDQYYLWLFHLGNIVNIGLEEDEYVHKLFQGYAASGKKGSNLVRCYAREFYHKHDTPVRIEYLNLRQEKEVEVTVKKPKAPVAGDEDILDDNEVKFKVKPWNWDGVFWYFKDGTKALYPAYEKIKGNN